MIYRYWYIFRDEALDFGAVKEDTYDMGPFYYPASFILKKLSHECEKLGRRFLRYKQERSKR